MSPETRWRGPHVRSLAIPAAKFSKGSGEEAAPADAQANTGKLSRSAWSGRYANLSTTTLWALRRQHLQFCERRMRRAPPARQRGYQARNRCAGMPMQRAQIKGLRRLD